MRIHCSAPLPEEPAGPLLPKMLVPAPYKAPKKEASKKAKDTRSGLRRRGASNTKSEDSNTHPSSEDEEEEEEDESSMGGEEKDGLLILGGRIAKEGKKSPSRGVHRGYQ